MKFIVSQKHLARFIRIYLVNLLIMILLIPTIASAQSINDIGQNNRHSIYNDTVWYTGNGLAASSCGNNLIGSDNEAKAFYYFVGKGLSDAQAAGVIGNLMQESSVVPTRIQSGGTSQNPADAGSGGWGIAQWTPGTKALDEAAKYGITGPIYELSTQLDLVWAEMNGTSPTGVSNMVQGLEQIKGNDAAAAASAADYFEKNFEGAKDGGNLPQREKYAQEALANYGGSGAPGGSSSSCITISCNTQSSNPSVISSNILSDIRQNVICIAQQELALWKSQPGYGNKYPDFPYAQTGLLKYTGGSCNGNTCSGGVYEEWCADFVSWVYNQAGYPFSGGFDGGWRVPGVAAIQQLGEQNANFHWHPGNSYTPKPGDIAIHSDKHTNIFISYSGGQAQYIGGDQGSGPYGQANPPENGAIVSIETGTGYYDNGITGYVSPD